MPRIEVFDRESVIDQAKLVFWEKGYNATSMQDLVDATGLNRSSIYNSFGSKMELYQLTLKKYQKEATSFFQMAMIQAKDPLEALKNIFSGALDEMLTVEGKKGCFNMNCKSEMSRQDETIKNWLVQTQEQSIHLFQDLVAKGQDDGIINKNRSSEAYAHYLFSAFQGFRMTGILIQDRKKLQSVMDAVFTTIT